MEWARSLERSAFTRRELSDQVMRTAQRKRSLIMVVDLAIAVSAVVVGWQWLPSPAVEPPLAPLLAEGRTMGRLSVPLTTEWNVVLIVSPNCPTCLREADFYAAVGRAALRSAAVGVVAVAAEPRSQVQDWLASNEIHADHIVEWRDLVGLGIATLPTVAVLGPDRAVLGLVTGEVNDKQSEQLIAWVGSPSPDVILDSSVVPVAITEDEYSALGNETVLIDVRHRDEFATRHARGATNLPFDEIEVRASIEIHASDTLVVDCRNITARRCRSSGVVLTYLGFVDVRMLEGS